MKLTDAYNNDLNILDPAYVVLAKEMKIKECVIIEINTKFRDTIVECIVVESKLKLKTPIEYIYKNIEDANTALNEIILKNEQEEPIVHRKMNTTWTLIDDLNVLISNLLFKINDFSLKYFNTHCDTTVLVYEDKILIYMVDEDLRCKMLEKTLDLFHHCFNNFNTIYKHSNKNVFFIAVSEKAYNNDYIGKVEMKYGEILK